MTALACDWFVATATPPLKLAPDSVHGEPASEWNRTNVPLHRTLDRPPVVGKVIDAHCHLLGARHAATWFETADHFGIDTFFTMGPLDEALSLQRAWGHRLHFIAVPNWHALTEPDVFGRWHRSIESFFNLGSRIAKLHLAPGTMKRTGMHFDHPGIRGILRDIASRGMAIMTHVGDPQLWYDGKYAEPEYRDATGTRDAQYAAWERALEDHRGTPWLGAHLGGNPEDFPRLQRLLDTFPDLMLDLSATRWIVREVSARRDEARAFILRNQDRLLWGSDQVSGDARDFEFLASRWWAHRMLWETDYQDTTLIFDPDLPEDRQPVLNGLALPTAVIQKLYRDNAVRFMRRMGVDLG